MEIYEFRQITQASRETLKEFYHHLKEMSFKGSFVVVLIHILVENHHVLQMAENALNVKKLDILENIVYQNNGNKHVNHNQMNTNIHNNVISEKKFMVCPNTNKVTLTKSSSMP